MLNGLPFAEREVFFLRIDAEHAPKEAKGAERAGAQEREVGPVFVLEEIEKAAGGVGSNTKASWKWRCFVMRVHSLR